MALAETQHRAATAVAEKFGLTVDRWVEMYRYWMERLSLEERRSRREEERAMIAQARKEKAVRPGEVTGERLKRGDLVDAEVLPTGADPVRLGKFITGQSKKGQQSGIIQTKLAQDPVDRMAARKEITPRQANAAGQLRSDYQLGILGARDPDQRDPYMAGHGWSGQTYAEATLKAAGSYAKAIKELGPSLAPIVIAVVCELKTVKDLAQVRAATMDGASEYKRNRTVEYELTWTLKNGLDRLGDAYRMPGEVMTEKVVSHENEKAIVTIKYRHEADGRISAISFEGLRWLVQTETLGELRDKARDRMNE